MQFSKYIILLTALIHGARARQEPHDVQMMADFTREAFRAPGSRRSIHGYTNFKTSELTCDNKLLAEKFALWTNDTRKEVIFALRGTPLLKDPTNSDSMDDVLIAKNNFSQCDRAQRSLSTLRAIQQQFAGYSIILVGHSLGGTTSLLLLAQDAHNNIITQEKDQPRSAISAVWVYNAYKGGLTSEIFGGDMDDGKLEPFFKLAFSDRRLHGVFVQGDLLSTITRELAEAMLPEDRLYIAELPFPKNLAPALFAHNIDGEAPGSLKLTSPEYNFEG